MGDELTFGRPFRFVFYLDCLLFCVVFFWPDPPFRAVSSSVVDPGPLNLLEVDRRFWQQMLSNSVGSFL